MNPTVTIESPIGSVTLYGANQHRDGALQVGAGFFRDWYSLSESKSEVRERPVGDGAFGIDHDWRSALPLNLTGRVRGAEWATQFRRLRAIVGAGVPVWVTVIDDLGQSTRIVSIRSFVPSPNPGAQYAEYQIVMVATDSRMYGPAQAVTTFPPSAGTGQPWPQVWPADWGTPGADGRATATNNGSTTTPLSLTVTGGMDGVELVEIGSGKVLRLERLITEASTVTFDVGLTRAYIDDPANDVTGFMTRREWDGFLIPAGGSRTVQFNPLGTRTGSPFLALSWADAD